MEIIWEKPGYIKVIYDPTRKVISFNWQSFFVSLEELIELHTEALIVAQDNNVQTYIANTSNVKGVLKPECVIWWGNFVSTLSRSGIKRIITILPQSALEKLATQTWQGKVCGIEMPNVKDMVEAYKLIV